MNKFTFLAALSICVNFSSGSLAQQTLPAQNLVEQVLVDPPAILPLRDRAKLEDKWVADRLGNVLPALMREQNIDMWVLIAREYVEDPVVDTMLNAESMHARRRTIMLFYDPGEGRPVERLTVSRYGMGHFVQAGLEPGKGAGPVEAVGRLDNSTSAEADRY